MAAQKRRRSDTNDSPPVLKSIPHYILYPIAGFFVGIGSPLGAFLMRYWLANPILKSLWVQHELQYNFIFYAYMGSGTIAAFMVFGYILGLRSEKQRVSNRILGARVEELHIKSVTDSLTGTYTHGYLHEVLELEMQRALTERSSISLLILDIDDFKKINDTHGHLFGDRVIKETAEVIVTNIRGEDILGRYGGDEFLVIMPGADHDTAHHVAKRVCAGIAHHGDLATVSIGVATFRGERKEGPKQVLARADANLYEAKHEGKNRVKSLVRAPHHGHGHKKNS